MHLREPAHLRHLWELPKLQESIAFVSDEDCTVLSDEEDDDLADILGVASGVSDPSSTRVLNASRRKIIETREAIKPFLTHMKSAERRAREQQQQLFQMQQQNNIESQYMMFTAMGHKVPMPLHMQERLVEAAKMSAAEADKVLPPVAPVDKVPEPPTEPPAASAPVAPAPPPVTPVPFNGYESPGDEEEGWCGVETLRMQSYKWEFEQTNPRLKSIHLEILETDNIYYASEYHPWLANVQNQQVGQTFHYKGRQGLTIGEATRQFMAALTLAGDPDYLEHHQGPPEMCSDYEEEDSQFEEADVVVPATQLDAADTADTADVEGGDADAAISVEGSGSDSDETQL
ncbi:hypothetical protein CYMTET_16716 [Cymbomonas tetramitiformis]|uniref:Uncharacterized protein n=1 Tax=Cymbomonas tetramitiformis TaxID=36881 RepID=A0AAE0GCV0_9CHLO|nr:hypothetical protein CYMTET_16716 [Cymbomonas tetramitiformis]